MDYETKLKKLKPGKAVSITKTPSQHTSGRIHEVRQTGRGPWFDVRVGGTPKAPVIASYRAGDLQLA